MPRINGVKMNGDYVAPKVAPMADLYDAIELMDEPFISSGRPMPGHYRGSSFWGCGHLRPWWLAECAACSNQRRAEIYAGDGRTQKQIHEDYFELMRQDAIKQGWIEP